MKKVKIKAGWTDDDSILNRLLEQFKTSDDDVSNIQFVKDNSYDLIVFNNYINETISENTESCIFFHEPTWVGTHQKNFTNCGNITIYGFDKELYTPSNLVVETPAHMFYGGRGYGEDSFDVWNYKNIINTHWKKTKHISSTITTLGRDNGDNGPSECTYNTRCKIISSLIEKCNFIDFYGGWGDTGNLKGFPSKLTALSEYKFCLTIENQFTKNLITEKFYDCILTNTIPIYYGCQNIKSLWPEHGYILLNDINCVESIVEQLTHIHSNSDKIYNDLLPELLKMKKRYFEDFNLLKKINNMCV